MIGKISSTSYISLYLHKKLRFFFFADKPCEMIFGYDGEAYTFAGLFTDGARFNMTSPIGLSPIPREDGQIVVMESGMDIHVNNHNVARENTFLVPTTGTISVYWGVHADRDYLAKLFPDEFVNVGDDTFPRLVHITQLNEFEILRQSDEKQQLIRRKLGELTTQLYTQDPVCVFLHTHPQTHNSHLLICILVTGIG